MYKLWSYEILSVPSQRGPEVCRIGLNIWDHSEDIFPCLRFTRLPLPHCSYEQSHSACQLYALSKEKDKIFLSIRHYMEFVILLHVCKVSQWFQSQSTQPCTGTQGADAIILFWKSSVTAALYLLSTVLLQCFSFKCYQISEPGQVNKSCYSEVNSTAKKLVRFWLPAELQDQSVCSMIPRTEI